jgi:hypothetical protein
MQNAGIFSLSSIISFLILLGCNNLHGPSDGFPLILPKEKPDLNMSTA